MNRNKIYKYRGAVREKKIRTRYEPLIGHDFEINNDLSKRVFVPIFLRFEYSSGTVYHLASLRQKYDETGIKNYKKEGVNF
jgi:hypothetical protein